ncbi:DNA polymerase [Pseudoalteromonas umbrosa]|uniref:DNA polymerase n=1 Tax=Pseudoalteromonas umbrosa TaxID=3048489 RepID=UPI0024C401D2|nr:DNA polymerase [Pseudoalteromonas sp. B95]MDK1290142.1 DNA polymerase [Pseudoalteromonas sp. B95]
MAGSFFGDRKKKRIDKKVPMRTLGKGGCHVCPLKDTCEKMTCRGELDNDIALVIDRPAVIDERAGEFLTGSKWLQLKSALPSGWLRNKITVHALVQGATPDNDEAANAGVACRSRFDEDFLAQRPTYVLGLGYAPLKHFLGEGDIQAWRGRQVLCHYKGHSFWYFPLYSVDYVASTRRERQKEINEYERAFIQDIKRFCRGIQRGTLAENPPQPVTSGYEDNIEIIMGQSDEELARVETVLEEMGTWPEVGIDIETTRLRPYSNQSKVVTIAIGTDDHTIAFPVNHPKGWNTRQRARIEKALRRFLRRKKTRKIAHNLPFEQEWLSYFYGDNILNSPWDDTMAMGYVLDVRQGVLNLDALCQIHLGFRLKELTSVDTRDVLKADLHTLLLYNGMDTKYTYLLKQRLWPFIDGDKDAEWVHGHLIRSCATLARTQQVGLNINSEWLANFRQECIAEITKLETSLDEVYEIQKYNSRYGRRKGKLQHSSPADLLVLYKDMLQRPEVMVEDNFGNRKPSTDDSVMEKLENAGLESAGIIRKLRKLTKIMSTYVDAWTFSNEALDKKGKRKGLVHDDGKLHASFNLYRTGTGRLSSSDPNAQNFPKRGDGKKVRQGISCPKGHHIVSVDYGQIEARVWGMISHDENFCRALWDNYDVHMAWAKKIATAYPSVIGGEDKLDDIKAMKAFRGSVKNQWVFPLFFGSSMFSCARTLQIPTDVIQPLYDEFWDTFAGVKRYQDRMVDFYKRNGYVQTMTGRKRHGPLSYNQLVNSPVQGTASDIVVDAMNRMVKEGIQPAVNIHDDITFYCPEDEVKDTVEFVAELMCLSDFDFINVPLLVEAEAGEHWACQEVIGEYSSEDFIPNLREKISGGI